MQDDSWGIEYTGPQQPGSHSTFICVVTVFVVTVHISLRKYNKKIVRVSRAENMARDATRLRLCHVVPLVIARTLLSSCTMSTLDKLAIRGIRSFDDKSISIIQFLPPVTVIVGHNGSGKTTIIECLKYATTGDQPPGTRGGAFIHDPKIANEKEVKAQVRLRFRAADGRRIFATRNLSVTMKKTAGMTMKTLEGILAIENEDGNNAGKVRCSAVETPLLMYM